MAAPLSTPHQCSSYSSQAQAQAPIAIIGAGPCGLTLARLFETSQPKIPYKVFERDASATSAGPLNQGGTLDLHGGSGQAALKAAGLHDEFERFARRDAQTTVVQNPRGGDFARFGDEAGADTDADAARKKLEEQKGTAFDRPEIDRSQLRDILLRSVPAENVVWGRKLKAVERTSDGGASEKNGAAADLTLQFEDGSSETGFRLIVGADGAWSKVRPLISNAKPYYSGYTYIEGRISQDNPHYAAVKSLVGAGNAMSMGAGRLQVLQQMSDESYRLYAGLQEPEGFTKAGGLVDMSHVDTEKTRAALLGAFEGWADNLRAHIQHAEGPWRYWPLYTLESEIFTPEALGTAAWKRTPGAVLIGDAAHLSVPNGGGVNEAMLDALRLWECISAESKASGGFDADKDAEAIERAVVAYEAEMRPRAREHVVDGIQMTEMMFSEDGSRKMIAFFDSAMTQAGQGAETAA